MKANYTYDSIGKDMHLSSQNVIDVFDGYYDYERPFSLPTILSFDEKLVMINILRALKKIKKAYYK